MHFPKVAKYEKYIEWCNRIIKLSTQEKLKLSFGFFDHDFDDRISVTDGILMFRHLTDTEYLMQEDLRQLIKAILWKQLAFKKKSMLSLDKGSGSDDSSNTPNNRSKKVSKFKRLKENQIKKLTKLRNLSAIAEKQNKVGTKAIAHKITSSPDEEEDDDDESEGQDSFFIKNLNNYDQPDSANKTENEEYGSKLISDSVMHLDNPFKKVGIHFLLVLA